MSGVEFADGPGMSLEAFRSLCRHLGMTPAAVVAALDGGGSVGALLVRHRTTADHLHGDEARKALLRRMHPSATVASGQSAADATAPSQS